MSFRNLPVKVSTTDGRNFVLLEALVFTTLTVRTLRAPAGSTTDGLSIPQVLWTAGLPPFGDAWLAGVLHDAAYRDQLEELVAGSWKDGIWKKVTLPKNECDSLFLEALLARGVEAIKAQTLYEGVALGGQAAFDANRLNK